MISVIMASGLLSQHSPLALMFRYSLNLPHVEDNFEYTMWWNLLEALCSLYTDLGGLYTGLFIFPIGT